MLLAKIEKRWRGYFSCCNQESEKRKRKESSSLLFVAGRVGCLREFALFLAGKD
jgi:hypothetical protein